MNRRKIAKILVSLFIIYSTTLAVFFLDSELEAKVEVENQRDPENLGVITKLEVSVTNNEDYGFKPVFTSLDSEQRRHSLFKSSNKSKIDPGETKKYNITLKSNKEGLKPNQKFKLVVNPKGKTSMTFSEKKETKIRTEGLKNPDLVNMPKNYRYNYGWFSPRPNVERGKSSIKLETDENHAVIRQYANPPGFLNIRFNNSFSRNVSGWKDVNFVIKLRDSRRSVTLIPSEVDDKQIIESDEDLPRILIPSELSEGRIKFNISKLYQEENWSVQSEEYRVEGRTFPMMIELRVKEGEAEFYHISSDSEFQSKEGSVTSN